jgi:hypothetical protein
MNWLSYIFLGIAFVALNGCATDRRLAPPVSSEHVSVKVKIPQRLSLDSMKAVYSSSICKRTVHDGNGRSAEVDSFHGVDISWSDTNSEGVYEAKVPVDGGGACGWGLANVKFGVRYSDLLGFAQGVTFGGGGGVIVMLDHHNSAHGGADFKVAGNLTLRQDYYPWLSTGSDRESNQKISLVTQGGVYLKYRALGARVIYFEPVLHDDFVVVSQDPAIKKPGSFTIFTYPDGTTESNGRWRPNFQKLQAIRLKTAADGD